ncbi:MAG: hypothetical protein KDA45_00195 [Planctomycetales bacterium]|nr:hypothetical protein [Planctomycetales bacterium]
MIEPAASQLLEELMPPRFDGRDAGLEFCGKPLDVVRSQARQEVFDLARHFTSRYRDTPYGSSGLASGQPLLLSGHQPELFHAGVWFKNFLLAGLAAQSGGVGINFLVDNDLCRMSSIRVPAQEAGGGYVAKSVPFDTPRDAIPWELRRLGSAECWQQFPASVKRVLLPEAEEPLLSELWGEAVSAVRSSDRLGLALAQARHKLEEKIGLQTLEVPLSHLVSTRGFARFSIQLLSELPRFQEIYNSQLEHYRLAHRIRSHAHPVPALEQEHGWLEAPLWIYRSAAPKRQRLWVRVLDNQLILSDRAGWQAVIEGRLDCDNAASQWLDLLADGVCLRPRALLTTMYLRIMVSDLFIHGIGGGKYDQLTDAIVRKFFAIDPPPMAVATATLQLPLGEHADIHHLGETDEQRKAQRDRLWKLKYHAEQVDGQLNDEARLLAAKKQSLLEHIPPRGEKWEWHRQITAVNRRLSELTAEQQQQAKTQLEQLATQERYARVLFSREYSFCLYPLDFIAQQLSNLVTL